jgi:superfamily I DNA and/or RNA helicase
MSFQNPVLEKLFKGILQDKPVEFNTNLIDRSLIDQAVTDLPMPLSERQKDALYKAWQNEISYIQGPPGTGKSYTIVAIMISALLLNKKVLFVSQKKAAIDVVRRKLEEFLGKNTIIYVGSESQDRKQIQEYIATKLSEIGTYDIQNRISQKEEQLHTLKQEIYNLKENLKRHTEQLKKSLEIEYEFHQANSIYLKSRDNFADIFGKDYTKGLDLRDEGIDEFGRAWVFRNLDKIQKKFSDGSVYKRKDIFYIKRFYKQCIDNLKADKNKFSVNKLGEIPLYLELLFKLNNTYANTISIKRKINPNLNQIRQMIQYHEQALLDKKRQYIKQQTEYQFIKNLHGFQNIAEEFRKLLRWAKQNRILEAMSKIDYNKLANVFPLWASEIKDLGQFLPFQNEIFDLVIVDEASQVNIAEIIPAFYRGRSFCVVGDDRQLGLNAAGLFALNKNFERLIWNRFFTGLNQAISYERAEEKALIVSKSSILDFIINDGNHLTIPKVILNEHFRSMPQLAKFTSKAFYDDSLLIMTEVGKNANKSCFEAIEVGGQREANRKIVPEEIEELINRLNGLIRENTYLQEPLSQHGFTLKNKPTIGILSFLTDQKNAIKERLQEEFPDDEWNDYQLFVGTPEEFQGNERNIMFITLGLDGTNEWQKGHHENPNRFNVATSRAINYTYLIYGGIPRTAKLLKEYLRNFGYQVQQGSLIEPTLQETVEENKLSWKFDELKVESEFEFKVLEYLKEFIQNYGSESLKIYNQVWSCSKRLDFVIFNSLNEECCAVEVDGVHHFTENGYTYSEEHLARIEILQRAGWKIVHVPYHKWYDKGWLCDRDNSDFLDTITDLYKQIKTVLAVQI